MPEKYRRPRDQETGPDTVRMERAWAAVREALATVRRFNDKLSSGKAVWFWPKIAAAITAERPWLVIACDSCGTIVDLDLRDEAA